MAGVYNRIEKVAEYYGISMLALSKRIGRKDAQVFYDMKSGKVQGISSNLLEKFKENLPEINMVWLQTGEGDMLSKKKIPLYDIPRDTISLILGHSSGNPVTRIYIREDMAKADRAMRTVIDLING